MAHHERFFDLQPPCFFVTTLDDSALANLSLELDSPKMATRTIRGRKSRSVDAFFNEIAAALQFPYYFGENGAALMDCITDLEWLPGDAYLLIVSDGPQLLVDEIPDHFESIVQTLADARERWLTPNKYFPRDRQPTPFHVLFQCPSGELDAFTRRLSQAAVEFEINDPVKDANV